MSIYKKAARGIHMKKFIEATMLLVLLLLLGSAALGQSPLTFQTGDVFAGIGNGKIQVYRLTPQIEGQAIYTLVATLTGPSTNTYDTGMAFDAAGNLYATDYSVGQVAKFDVHGSPSLFAGDFGAVNPESLAFDSTGNLFVGDANGFFATDTGPLQANIWKLDSTGHLAGSFTVTAEIRGADWVDLAADQHTILYTSEGTSIKRFDTTLGSHGTQLSDFATGLPGSNAFALRILPNGNVLVADSSAVVQVNTSGAVVQTYVPPNNAGAIFSLSLDPDGVHFWTGDTNSGNIWEINIATGSVDQTISTGVLQVADTTAGLFGVAVFGEKTSSNTANLLFTPSPTPETQIATIGNPTDPAAQSLALTLASVTNAINVSVEFFYEPTDLSTGTTGVGIADGDCEAGADDTTDFDCRLATTFTYPAFPTAPQTLPGGGRLVPHIIPSHNNLGVWVRVIATRVLDGKPAVAGIDYAKSVDWYYAWNANPSLIPFSNFAATNAAFFTGPVNPEYQPGWNNQNPQMYDRPGANPSIDFVFNITTFSKNCNPPPPNTPSCVGTADPGVGGHTITLNDIVAAAPPNPPVGTAANTVEPQVPVPGISPFPYFKGLPMLVSFELENEATETSIANALTPPHSVNVATLDFLTGKNIPVQFPRGFPTTFTYNKSLKSYYIFLSPAPYAQNTKYTLQINSDLFPAPVTATFVVK
jgi:hypothetical protein